MKHCNPKFLLACIPALLGACEDPNSFIDTESDTGTVETSTGVDDESMPGDAPGVADALPGDLADGDVQSGYILDIDGNPIRMTFTDVNGQAIHDGDMGMGPVATIAATPEEALERAEPVDEAGGSQRTMYGATARWPGGVMRFKIKGGIDARIVQAARDAAANYNQFTAETGVRLEEVAANYVGDYVLVLPTTDAQTPTICAGASPCSEWIGYKGGEQKVWLNVVSNISMWQVASHEFGHALGQYHEHSRCERDSFITLGWAGAIEGPFCDRATTEPYNTWSIMHYSAGEFGTRASFKPGVSVPPAKSLHPGLVDTDRRSLAKMYGGGGGASSSYVSFMNGRCLDASSSANGTNVHMWDCLGANHANQRWTYNQASGELKIFGNKCLDAWGAKRLDPIVVHDCHGGANQKWDINTYGQIKLRGIVDEYNRPMCIDIAHYKREAGAKLLLQYCHRGDNQAWRRSPGGVGGATFNIESDITRCADAPSSATDTRPWLWTCAGSNINQRFTRTATGELRVHGKCLDGDASQPGNPVKVWDCHGGANQRWMRDLLGRYVLESNPAVCLDVNGGVSSDGANLWLYSCHTGGNQKWTATYPYNP